MLLHEPTLKARRIRYSGSPHGLWSLSGNRASVGAMETFKKALRPLGAIVGITGAAALVNRRLRTASALPLDHVGGVRRPWNWRGFDIFATELGSGPIVLLVQGIDSGASSFEY